MLVVPVQNIEVCGLGQNGKEWILNRREDVETIGGDYRAGNKLMEKDNILLVQLIGREVLGPGADQRYAGERLTHLPEFLVQVGNRRDQD